MDITDTLTPKSDQLDAVDLAASGPRAFTITEVAKGSPDQPVQVRLAEFPRVWRPGKSMRRVLAAAWGTDVSQWVGKRVTLYCDPDVQFGGEAVGGTRISHMSHIGETLRVPLLVKRGKSAMHTVEPLRDSPAAPSAPTVEQIVASDDRDALKGWWRAHPDLRLVIEARVAELTPTDTPEEQS